MSWRIGGQWRENVVLLETSKWTYGLEIERNAQSVIVDVRPRARTRTYGQSVTRELYFYHSSHSFYFPYSRVVVVEIGLIEGFP